MNKFFFIIAFLHIVFVIAFMIIFDYQLISDSIRYLAVANELASLEFQFSANMNCHTAPGYPFFLALIKPITWHNTFLIAIVQSIVFIVSLHYFLLQVQLKYKLSYLSILLLTGLVLFNPEIIHLNGTVLTENLAASLILFVYGSLISTLRRKNDTLILVICFSFLILVKMEYALLLFIVIPHLIFVKKYKTILITSITLISLLFLNSLKNHSVYGIFKLTSFGSGTVIYGGNNLNLDGSWHIHGKTKNYIPDKYEAVFDSIYKLDAVCACIKQDSLYKRMALEAWKTSYIDQLKVIPVKLGKQWLLPGCIDFYTGQGEIYKGLQIEKLFSNQLWPWYGKWKHGAYLLIYWSSLILSIIGLCIKVNFYDFDNFDFLIISTLFISTIMYSIPFYGLGRFHLPIISLLLYYIVYIFVYFENKMLIATNV